MPTLHGILESTQRLRPSKWFFDINHYAESIGITKGEANGFIKCIEDGGKQKADGTWQANPEPFHKAINLTDQCDNLLNLHYVDNGRKVTHDDIDEPSIAAIDQASRFVRLGRVCDKNKEISVKVQREIAKFVIGTHKTLAQYYPVIAEFRKNNWRAWIEGGESSNQFQRLHLPYIAVHFWSVWDAPIERKIDPLKLTPTILDLVKNEIIEMLVRMYILPADMLKIIAMRRSRRNLAVSVDTECDIEIVPRQNKRKRLTYAPVSSPESPEPEDMDEDNSVLSLFNFGVLKRLWAAGKQKEVGRREVAFLAIDKGRTRESANREIQRHGGFP